MFALIGFLAFALTSSYLDQDIGAPLYGWVSNRLARAGWTERVPGDPGSLMRRPRRWIFRQLWALQVCPYCLATWIAFFASWYALHEHPWHRSFWLTWWGAVGVAWLVTAMQKYHQELVVEIGERREDKARASWEASHSADE